MLDNLFFRQKKVAINKTKSSETVENQPSSFTSIPNNVENPKHSSSSSNKDVEDVPTMVLRERLYFSSYINEIILFLC